MLKTLAWLPMDNTDALLPIDSREPKLPTLNIDAALATLSKLAQLNTDHLLSELSTDRRSGCAALVGDLGAVRCISYPPTEKRARSGPAPFTSCTRIYLVHSDVRTSDVRG